MIGGTRWTPIAARAAVHFICSGKKKGASSTRLRTSWCALISATVEARSPWAELATSVGCSSRS
jgi:hypothetical protein